DFGCGSCSEEFQLKSQSRSFGSRVLDSAYQPMVESIFSSSAPNFLFLHYLPVEWRVHNVFIVPRHFLSMSVIERRAPLRPTARRAGWVGCNILLSALPQDARIGVVQSGSVRPEEEVRRAWQTFSFLKDATPESRGWTADVLACVRELGTPEFTLAELYRFEPRLSAMHRDNRNVRAKVRQQLQLLRDRGVLDFLGRGSYRILQPGRI
ncbi:MAG TPA: DpnI domain-containing protein, partial [Thermoplasmata archaeon]|nr:DpnI domain-containing protein [Thermoplasmata archaeon]